VAFSSCPVQNSIILATSNNIPMHQGHSHALPLVHILIDRKEVTGGKLWVQEKNTFGV
jgi:hypothetical protein